MGTSLLQLLLSLAYSCDSHFFQFYHTSIHPSHSQTMAKIMSKHSSTSSQSLSILTLQSGVSLTGLLLWNQVTVGVGRPVTWHSSLNFWPALAITLLSGIVNLGRSVTSTAVIEYFWNACKYSLLIEHFGSAFELHILKVLITTKHCYYMVNMNIKLKLLFDNNSLAPHQ